MWRMPVQGSKQESQEPYCRETMTPVSKSQMRPGYDCRCSGCMAWVTEHGDPMKKTQPGV